MYLKRLEVQGFKTFATRTVFEFKPGITAIVGANGSGKSNCLDAVRWVLGEQSYAALRCKRTEELLYSGGNKRPPAGLAEATLTVDNADRVLPLAFDEVTITRRATRAGDNEYFINKARVRLRDVQELASALGGSYTIINQGMVDAALTLRAEDRRRLFEDAAGIGGFEARQHEAERRLRETDANIARVSDVLSELEPQLRSLKRQATQARAFHELNDELRALLAQSYRSQWQAAQQAVAAAEQADAVAVTALDERRKEHEGALASLTAQRGELRGLREAVGELHQREATLHKEAEAVQREVAIRAERLAALHARVADATRERADLDTRHAEATTEVARHDAALAAAQAALAKRRDELRAIAEHDPSAEQRAAAQQGVDAAQAQLLHTAAAEAQQRSRIEQLTARRVQLQTAKAQAEAEVARLAQELGHTQAEQLVAQQMFAQVEQALAAAQQGHNEVGTAIDEQRRSRAEAEEALGVARRALADLEARFDSLDRLRRGQSGAAAGVRATLEWAERERRTGFVLVSSLLRTPAPLETAVEVALGARLQHIVVGAWRDAEDAIAQLKRSGAGRATFLPLDSLRPPRPLPAPQGGGVVGVAAELIDYDARYAKVVAQLLGRVLLVEDMPAARRVLQQLDGGWTIVTLGGEQVSSGGAVTGGAQTRDTGTLRRERELRELPPQIAAQRRSVAEHEAARNSFADAIARAEQARNQARQLLREREGELTRRRDSLAAAVRRAEKAGRDHEWHAARRAEREGELRGLAEQFATFEQALVCCAAQTVAAQGELAAAQTALDAARTADAERQQQIAAAQAALARAEGEARTARAVRDAQIQALARLGEQHAALEQRRVAAAREQALLESSLAADTEHHTALARDLAALQQELAPAQAAVTAGEEAIAAGEAQAEEAARALRSAESAQAQAALELARARDRQALIWERAAGDNIDVEQLAGEVAVEAMVGDVEGRIAQLRGRLQRMGPINPLALDEYEAAATRHGFLSGQIDDLRTAAASLRALIAELQATMDARLQATFEAVAHEFEGTFARLFGGGSAQLLLSRAGDDAAGANDAANGNGTNGTHGGNGSNGKIIGVDILARPPGKRQQSLSLLSGGERSLTAVALLLAILKVNPSPFCVLDEVDAALDESNVGRFRDALTDLTARTQFVIITHNRGTIEAADTLYGVSMNDDGSSKVLSLKLEALLEEPV